MLRGNLYSDRISDSNFVDFLEFFCPFRLNLFFGM
jgi:hypothetical protein